MLNTVIIINKTKGTYGVLVHVQFQSVAFNGGGGGGVINISQNFECLLLKLIFLNYLTICENISMAHWYV
jgi:hypothetical protein